MDTDMKCDRFEFNVNSGELFTFKTKERKEQEQKPKPSVLSFMAMQSLTDGMARMKVGTIQTPKTKEQKELEKLLASAQCDRCQFPSWKLFTSKGVTKNSLLVMENKNRQALFTSLCMPMHERMCLTSYLNNYCRKHDRIIAFMKRRKQMLDERGVP